MNDSTPKLNARQRLFVLEYIRTLNATQSAIVAGYSKRTAYSIGHELLKHPVVSAEIEAAIEQRIDNYRSYTVKKVNKPKLPYNRPSQGGLSDTLYLIRASNGAVKIGITNNLQRRLWDINCSSPLEIELIWHKKDLFASQLENELHRAYSHRHIRNEWFALTDQDISEIIKRYGR